MTPLLGAVPVFIPGNVHGRDEVAAFDAIFSTVGQHRLVQCRPLGNPVSRLAAAGGGNRHCAAPRRQQQVAFRGRTERILYLVPHNQCHETSFQLPIRASELAARAMPETAIPDISANAPMVDFTLVRRRSFISSPARCDVPKYVVNAPKPARTTTDTQCGRC